MATSSSYDFTATGTNLITDALTIGRVLRAGQTISSEQEAAGLRSLNLMIKAWQGESFGMWLNKEVALFQSDGGSSYDIGPTSTDHATISWVKTELASAGSASDTTITVDSDDGISDNDKIGIELDSGAMDWDAVDGTPASDVITITGLTSAAAVDNHVYAYTSLAQRPLQIIEARLRREGGTEVPLEIVSRSEYMALSDKDMTGTPNQIYYDKQLINGKMYVWSACSNVKEYIKFTGKYPIEDFDAAANTGDFPQEWLEAITYNLAIRLAPQFGKQVEAATLLLAKQLKDIVSGFDREETSVYFDIGD